MRCLLILLWALWAFSDAAAASAADGPSVRGLLVQWRTQASATPAGRQRPQAALPAAQRWQHLRAQVQVPGQDLARWQVQTVGSGAWVLVPPKPLSASQAQQARQALMAQTDVAWVEWDVREPLAQVPTPNDPLFAGLDGQWWLQPAAGSNALPLAARLRGVPGIQSAWAQQASATALPVVAVLDTGLTAHPDLAPQRWLPGYDMVSDWDDALGRGDANDGDGRDADPADPGDWVSAADQAKDPERYGGCALQSSSWHGSAVAAELAASMDNALGGAGMLRQGMLLPVRVAGKCGASVRDIIDGMRWAAGLKVCQRWQASQDPDATCVQWAPLNAHPARIINISFGSQAPCHAAYQETIDELWRMGVVVVAAAGNQQGGLARPANCQHVVAVTAVNRDGFKARYANWGPDVTLATVGGDDASGAWGPLLADGGLLLNSNLGSQAPAAAAYARRWGTSFAAPLVSGTLAMMLAEAPNLTPSAQVEGLQRSARPHVQSSWLPACSLADISRCQCSTASCGAGLLDTPEALRWARSQAQGLNYQAPNWAVVQIDTPELRQAVAQGSERESPAQSTSSIGGGSMSKGELGGLLLLGSALAGAPAQRRRRRLVAQGRERGRGQSIGPNPDL